MSSSIDRHRYNPVPHAIKTDRADQKLHAAHEVAQGSRVGGDLLQLTRAIERGAQQFETGQLKADAFAQLLRQAAEVLEAKARAATPQRETLWAALSRPYRAGAGAGK
jgi:hypothetical protein